MSMSEKLSTGRAQCEKCWVTFICSSFVLPIFRKGLHVPGTRSSEPFTAGKDRWILHSRCLRSSSSFLFPSSIHSLWLGALIYPSFHLAKAAWLAQVKNLVPRELSKSSRTKALPSTQASHKCYRLSFPGQTPIINQQ